MQHDYEFVIVGAGLIGVIIALALAQHTKKSIALLNDKPIPSFKQSQPLDTRTLALNQGTIDFLIELNLWHRLASYANPIERILVSEQGAFARCELTATEVGYHKLGSVIEIQLLYQQCLEELSQYDQIHFYPSTPLTGVHRDKNQWHLQTSNQNFNAQYLLTADGTFSQIRQWLQIENTFYDYQQSALVAVAQASLPHQNTAFERFTHNHILAILPLTGNRIGTVLTVPNSEQEEWLTLSDTAYLTRLQDILGWRLGKLHSIGKRAHYPLYETIAKTLVKNNAILLGNAAHTLNPLGAQGFNLGIAGIRECIHTLVRQESLESFSQKQLDRCHELVNMIHNMQCVFGSRASPTVAMRRFALFTLQYLSSKKQHFIRRMMGICTEPG